MSACLNLPKQLSCLLPREILNVIQTSSDRSRIKNVEIAICDRKIAAICSLFIYYVQRTAPEAPSPTPQMGIPSTTGAISRSQNDA